MTIETKYNIGQEVFRMHNNKVVVHEIRQITINVKSLGDAPPAIESIYTLADNSAHKEFYLFPSREELLNSL